MKFKTILLIAAASLAVAGSANAASAPGHPARLPPEQLFVGTCYQPVDRTPEQIHRDIALMKKAGFTVVRMGDLSWDSCEPAR